MFFCFASVFFLITTSTSAISRIALASCNRIPSFDNFQGLPAQNVVHQHKAQSLLTPCVLSVCVLQGEGVSIDGDRGRASCQCSTSQRNGPHSPDPQRDKLHTRAVIHCDLCNHCSHLHCDLASNHCLGTSAPRSHSEHFFQQPCCCLLGFRLHHKVTFPRLLPLSFFHHNVCGPLQEMII